ncbi:Ntn hydrolase family protein [Halolamina salina]|uniref:Proteasome beta subunit n=1 Tax=Halolamina salina TaxID=1220023 RepID=A0ABD6B880_9EURY
MPTVVAFETEGGAVLAADRLVVDNDTVSSKHADRIAEFGDCGAAAVADPGEFRRELDGKRRAYESDHGENPGIEPFTRMATGIAEAVGTDAAVAARDGEGHAQVRAVYADGSVIDDSPVALGTGAELAFGRLEAGVPSDLDEAETFAREVIEGVAQRDTRTGEDADAWTLTSE